MKRNNKGFSLVELIVVIGMLAIVGTMIVSFVAISSRTYSQASAEIDIQEEAQLTLNQIKDLVIDTNRAVSYGLEAPDPANMKSFTVIDESNTEASIRADWIAEGVNEDYIKEVLVIYSEESHTTTEADGTVVTTYTYPVIKIIYDSFTGELYYAEEEFSDISSVDISSFGTSSSDIYLLSEYVTSFDIDLTNIEDSQVDMQIDFSSEAAGTTREYLATPTINLRNKIIVSENLSEIYADPGVTINSFIAGIDILKDNSVILNDTMESGTSTTYTALVDAQYGASEGYTWSLSGDDAGFKSIVEAATGTVTVPIDEPSSTLTLTAIATGDTSKTKSIPILIDPGLAPTSMEVSVQDSGIIGGIDDVRTILTFSAVTRYSDGTTTMNQDIDWTPPSNLPASSYYVISNGQLVVYLMSDAGLAEYNATATSTIMNYAGIYVSDSLDSALWVGDLSYIAPSPLVVEIDGADTLARGSNGEITLSTSLPGVTDDTTGVAYTWELLESESTGFSGTGYNSFDLITLSSGSSSDEMKLKADGNLNWDETYTVKVKVTAERTISGEEQSSSYVKTVTINPVEIAISNVSTEWQDDYFVESFNYELENLSLDASEQANLNYLVDSSGEVEFYAWGWWRTATASHSVIDPTYSVTSSEFSIQANRNYIAYGRYSATMTSYEYEFTIEYESNSITLSREDEE